MIPEDDPVAAVRIADECLIVSYFAMVLVDLIRNHIQERCAVVGDKHLSMIICGSVWYLGKVTQQSWELNERLWNEPPFESVEFDESAAPVFRTIVFGIRAKYGTLTRIIFDQLSDKERAVVCTTLLLENVTDSYRGLWYRVLRGEACEFVDDIVTYLDKIGASGMRDLLSEVLRMVSSDPLPRDKPSRDAVINAYLFGRSKPDLGIHELEPFDAAFCRRREDLVKLAVDYWNQGS